MRLIDADALKETLLKYNYTTARNQIFRYIDEQPTVNESVKGDLISRSAVIADIRKRPYIDNALSEIFETIIDEQPTAYNDGWIPVEERLPEEAYGCLVTVMDCNPMTGEEFENILPYFVGYDSHTWNNADGEEIPFEVLAWKPLPPAYQPKGE